MRSLFEAWLACKQNGVIPTRRLFTVSVARQNASQYETACCPGFSRSGPAKAGTTNKFVFVRSFRCSTSRFGIGQAAGSNCTPLGLHRIAEKIGGGWPAGTVFKARQPVGYTWRGMPDAKITTRILWLEGLEPGFNRGGNVDSHARYIYIHGTGDETTLGRPASCGCIHLAAADLIALYDRLPVGTLVWIGR